MEVGLYRCKHCLAILEIPRGTRNMNCPSCSRMLIREYFTYHAQPVSLAWLRSQSAELQPAPSRAGSSPSRPAPQHPPRTLWGRVGRAFGTMLGRARTRSEAGVPDALSLTVVSSPVQADAQAREWKLLRDEVFLVTRRTSTLFDVSQCTEENLESVESEPRSGRNSGKNPDVLCKICMDDQPNIVMRPCNHGGLCEKCARIILSRGRERSCPWCRISVQRVLKFDATCSTLVKARVLDM